MPPSVCGLPGCSTEAFDACSYCQSVCYCSKEHQASDWKAHKKDCRPRDLLPPATVSPSGPKSRRVVVLIDTSIEDWKIENLSYYQPFLAALRASCTLKICSTKDAVFSAMRTSPSPQAILLFEPDVLMKPKHDYLLNVLIDYMKLGCRLVAACQVSNFVLPVKLDKFFEEKLGLNWRRGDYCRTTHYLQRSHPLISTIRNPRALDASYSLKAMHLAGVNRADAIYAPSANSRTQSHVFASTPVSLEEFPVAMTKIGNGWFGWNGDVNAEEGSTKVLLMMLGLSG